MCFDYNHHLHLALALRPPPQSLPTSCPPFRLSLMPLHPVSAARVCVCGGGQGPCTEEATLNSLPGCSSLYTLNLRTFFFFILSYSTSLQQPPVPLPPTQLPEIHCSCFSSEQAPQGYQPHTVTTCNKIRYNIQPHIKAG